MEQLLSRMYSPDLNDDHEGSILMATAFINHLEVLSLLCQSDQQSFCR